jgi:hypothetical protein
MTKQSDFRSDREFNAIPDIHASLEEKLAYQRNLRQRWENMGDKPSAILDFPMPDPGRFWTDPFGIDPAVIAQQQLKRLKRIQ